MVYSHLVSEKKPLEQQINYLMWIDIIEVQFCYYLNARSYRILILTSANLRPNIKEKYLTYQNVFIGNNLEWDGGQQTKIAGFYFSKFIEE